MRGAWVNDAPLLRIAIRWGPGIGERFGGKNVENFGAWGKDLKWVFQFQDQNQGLVLDEPMAHGAQTHNLGLELE